MNNIKLYRGRKGLSQETLASMLGMSRTNLTYIETGKNKNFITETVEQMSEILEVTPCKLLGDANLRFAPQNDDDVDYMIKVLKTFYSEERKNEGI